jgi:TetR/AcrR family transcriptional regulator, lmrAB and yxaGH operons repressor
MNIDTGGGTRDRMIEAAIVLMRGSGLSGAGINEIVRESGAPKGSVYHFFPNGKLQIVTEALEIYSRRIQAFIEQTLATETRAPDKVKALFEAFARRAEDADFRRSCAVGAVTLDLGKDLETLRTVLATCLSDWVASIARHFDFGDASRSESFAGLLLTTIEGAHIRARAERSARPFREAGAWLALLAESGTPLPGCE